MAISFNSIKGKAMDIMRHVGIFDPEKNQNEKIAVIGAGATGSSMLLELAKLGCRNLSVFDDDKIESHNVSNQLLYGPEHVGKDKARTLAQAIDKLTGGRFGHINYSNKRVEGWTLPHSVVFLCVDSMAARQDIVTNCISAINCKLVIDIRIDAYNIQIVAFDPRDSQHEQHYVDALYSDEDVAPVYGTCQTVQSIGATAHIATGFATWLFMDILNGKRKDGAEMFFNVQSMKSQLHSIGPSFFWQTSRTGFNPM